MGSKELFLGGIYIFLLLGYLMSHLLFTPSPLFGGTGAGAGDPSAAVSAARTAQVMGGPSVLPVSPATG